jgi:hypothetical protein
MGVRNGPVTAITAWKAGVRVKGSFAFGRPGAFSLQAVKRQPPSCVKKCLKLETLPSLERGSIRDIRTRAAGLGMFVLRSLFWLATVTMLLPASPDGQPAPRVSLLQTAMAAKVLLQDITGVCTRHPEACATSREALQLLTMKVGTGAEIVSSGLVAGQAFYEASADHGTLTPADLRPEWSLDGAGR